jgi:hypothetical protein
LTGFVPYAILLSVPYFKKGGEEMRCELADNLYNIKIIIRATGEIEHPNVWFFREWEEPKNREELEHFKWELWTRGGIVAFEDEFEAYLRILRHFGAKFSRKGTFEFPNSEFRLHEVIEVEWPKKKE